MAPTNVSGSRKASGDNSAVVTSNPKARTTRSTASRTSVSSTATSTNSPLSVNSSHGVETRKASTNLKSAAARGPPTSSLARARAQNNKTADSAATPRAPSRKATAKGACTTSSRSLPAKSPSKRPASPMKVGRDVHENEPIKAYLRIRPVPENARKEHEEPYIQVISDTEVLMNPPKNSSHPISASRARAHAAAPSTKYGFTKVFSGDSNVSQSSFFQATTLPMVDELLQGSNGLIFTYGVTNSGKSYTVQGGSAPGEAGLLPRSMDMIFNSIKGLESESEIRPSGLAGVELISPEESNDGQASAPLNPFNIPGLSKRLLNDAISKTFRSSTPYLHDETKVKVDRNYRYSVWVSYVEVYNEKIFDLLDAVPPPGNHNGMPSSASGLFSSGMTRSSSFMGSNWSLAATANGGSQHPDGNGPFMLQRRPLLLKNDPDAGAKFVSGLREIKVRSVEEAHELINRGQENRAVFGTMANRASSRSHGVFTVKVIREHAGEMAMMERDEANTVDPSLACTVSRLSIVDLAGSERLGNTAVSGDRLKEAGNINKSLMCLGQCLETLRKNQQRAASFIPAPTPVASASTGSSAGAGVNAARGPNKRKPSIVPFRHSKLTELFQSYFTGEGKAVMIVNANPFDTGYDENSHVMRFSANAKEVHTVRGATGNLGRFVHPSLRSLIPTPKSSNANTEGNNEEILPSDPGSCLHASGKTGTHGSPEKKGIAVGTVEKTAKMENRSIQTGLEMPANDSKGEGQHTEVTIVEESDSDDSDETDPFVEYLMQKYEEMRSKLFDAEMRCGTIESQVREEMADEMGGKLLEMEQKFNERLLTDAQHNEEFVNRKIDLLVRANANEHQRLRARFDMTPKRPSVQDREEDNDVSADEDGLEVEKSLAAVEASPLRTRKATYEENQGSIVELLKPGRYSTLDINDTSVENDMEGVDGGLSCEVSDATTDEGKSIILHEEESQELGSGLIEAVRSCPNQEIEDCEEMENGSEEDESEEGEDEDADEDEDNDDSFEEEEEADSSFEMPKKQTRKSTAGQSQRKSATKFGVAAKARRSTNGLPLSETSRTNESASAQSTADSPSDESLVAEHEAAKKSPKKKRNLKKSKAVDEDAMIDQVGDSSLVDAIMQRSGSSAHPRSGRSH